MIWELLFKYWAQISLVLNAIEGIKASIDAGQPASTPPVPTYVDGKHGTITINWNPLP